MECIKTVTTFEMKELQGKTLKIEVLEGSSFYIMVGVDIEAGTIYALKEENKINNAKLDTI